MAAGSLVTGAWLLHILAMVWNGIPEGARVAGVRSLAAAYLGDDHQLDN